MNESLDTTIVTAGDRAFSWGALLLVASMRMNGMAHPVVVGTMDWTDAMKKRILALGGVTLRELPKSRRCVACQKPMMMGCDDVKTDWVCWADADGMFVGDCSEWLVGEDPDEIVIRKYDPAPSDFTDANLAVWKRDVARVCGKATECSRYETRVNTAFIVINRKWKDFLERWQRQMEEVLPLDVGIIMRHGTPYFQTDESVLASVLCFAPDVPMVTERYKANGSVDKSRYFAHFAYNPKPWQMWNTHSIKWRPLIMPVVDWLVDKGIVPSNEIPRSLRKAWWPLYRCLTPAAPWVWRAIKLKRRLFKV